MAEDMIPASVGSSEAENTEPVIRELIKLDAVPIVTIPTSSLLLDKSPRQGGENGEHTRMLAESGEQLPPIVVHVPSMRVIDGTHRVRAAFMRGEKTIAAKEYHGTDDDAFVLAVRMNIAHGLPLTRADRTAAAIRIIRSHPHWSDRMIATTVGLSPKTIAKVRRRSTVGSPQSTTRLGQDGRVRPVNHAAGRLRVAALLAEKPTSPIRAVAQEAGVSSSTARDVRQRLHAGQQPVPDGDAPNYRRPRRSADAYRNQGTALSWLSAGRADVAAILADLNKDRSLRSNDVTKSLLRCLERYRIDVLLANKIIEMVPTHRASSVAQLAREYVRAWTYIAAELEQRAAVPDFPAPSLNRYTGLPAANRSLGT
jgi:ParB-like chromosome segregation protein Spo0J